MSSARSGFGGVSGTIVCPSAALMAFRPSYSCLRRSTAIGVFTGASSVGAALVADGTAALIAVTAAAFGTAAFGTLKKFVSAAIIWPMSVVGSFSSPGVGMNSFGISAGQVVAAKRTAGPSRRARQKSVCNGRTRISSAHVVRFSRSCFGEWWRRSLLSHVRMLARSRTVSNMNSM